MQRESEELSIPLLEEERGTTPERTSLGLTGNIPCSPPQPEKMPASEGSTHFPSTPWGKGQEAQPHGV